jgi:hypothetical protein
MEVFKMEKQKITVYVTGEFMGNVQKYEGYLIDQGKMKYAQYDNAPFVSFTPKGKKNGVRIVKGYNPYILILKGWNHPEPQSMYGEPSTRENGVTVRASRYQSFDEGYKRDFNNMIDPYILKNQDILLADYREAIKAEVA